MTAPCRTVPRKQRLYPSLQVGSLPSYTGPPPSPVATQSLPSFDEADESIVCIRSPKVSLLFLTKRPNCNCCLVAGTPATGTEGEPKFTSKEDMV